jgi:arylsulfatase A-like enzyme
VQRLAFLSALALVWAAPAAAQNNAAQQKPNIVLVIMDDVGYGDYGSYGATDVRTPNIDRLATDGVRFTDFYAAPTCTPTRAMLMTGRYYQRTGLEAPLPAAPAGGRGLPATGQSLPQLLKNAGYATGLMGKWHLGYRPEYQPNAHGFDYFFGFLSGLVDYYQHTDSNGAHDLFENGTAVHPDGYMTDLITERSVRFIEQNAQRPFFLEVAYNAAHWPFQVPDRPSVAPGNARFVQPHEENTSTRADYVAMIERADQGVGRIAGVLEKLGLTRNTLVLFTNDNGGEWLSRNAPLFHRKGTVWEGGVRVPLIMKWPARLPAGRTSSQAGMMFDLTRTILAAAEAPVPAETRLEGIDLLPIAAGQSPPVERTLFFRVTGARGQRAVRQGDWKLLLDGGAVLLFNLKSDIGERVDLAKEQAEITRRLRPLILAWEKDVDSEAKTSGNVAEPAAAPGRGGAGRGGAGRGGAGRGGAAPSSAPN